MSEETFEIHAHWYPEDLPTDPAIVQEMLEEVGLDLHKSYNGNSGYYAVEWKEQ